MRKSWRLFTSAQDFFVSNGQSKKFELIKKSHVPDPFVSRAKALPAFTAFPRNVGAGHNGKERHFPKWLLIKSYYVHIYKKMYRDMLQRHNTSCVLKLFRGCGAAIFPRYIFLCVNKSACRCGTCPSVCKNLRKRQLKIEFKTDSVVF